MRFCERIYEDSRGGDTGKLFLEVFGKRVGLKEANACWVTGFCGWCKERNMGWTLKVGCMLSENVVMYWKLRERGRDMSCGRRCRIWATKYEKFQYLGCGYDAVRWMKWWVLAYLFGR